MYTIVDIESTGGKFGEEKVTEIALYKFDGKEVVDQFSTLVNPEKPIDSYVQKLTGITNKMVKRAPKFPEIAKRIVEISNGTTLVAHNAPFDYRMLKQEFEELGYEYTRDVLDTVPLSKFLIPNQKSYSLDKLSKALGIQHGAKHRAYGDALATVELFKILLEKDVDKSIIEKSISNKVYGNFAPKLRAMLEEVPTKTGVYYLHDVNGKIIFLRAVANMSNSLHQYFTGETDLALKIQNKTHQISFEETGSILIAKIKYLQERRVLRPKLNKYDRKVRKAPVEALYPESEMYFTDRGRNSNEQSYFMIRQGKFIGYGYFQLHSQIDTEEKRLARLVRVEETPRIKAQILDYLEKERKREERALNPNKS